MMYRVQITKQAERDLQEALNYISDTLHNPSASVHLYDKVEKELSSLSDFPERNPLVHDSFLAANGIRMTVIDNYLAFYLVHEQTKSVIIIRFLHGKRNWKAILTDAL